MGLFTVKLQGSFSKQVSLLISELGGINPEPFPKEGISSEPAGCLSGLAVRGAPLGNGVQLRPAVRAWLCWPPF